jgi:hypothetical protein
MAFRRNGGPTLGADSILAIRHPCQRDLQASGPLSQPRGGETRQLLMLDTLREIDEVAARGIGRRHCGLVLQSCDDITVCPQQICSGNRLHSLPSSFGCENPFVGCRAFGDIASGGETAFVAVSVPGSAPRDRGPPPLPK